MLSTISHKNGANPFPPLTPLSLNFILLYYNAILPSLDILGILGILDILDILDILGIYKYNNIIIL